MIKDFIVICSIYFVWVAIFGAIGVLLAPMWGLYVGLLVGIVVILCLFLLGDRFVLAYLKAEPAKSDDPVVAIVKNTSCRLGIKNVELYYTDRSQNIYALEDMRDFACIVLGREALKYCSTEEINILIFSALVKIKNNNIRFIQYVSITPFMAMIPRIVFRSIFPEKIWKMVANFFFLYELPSFLLKKFLVDKKKMVFAHDDEVARLTGAKELYASALFKMAHYPFRQTYYHQVIEDLAVAPEIRDVHIPFGVINSVSISERYNRLQ